MMIDRLFFFITIWSRRLGKVVKEALSALKNRHVARPPDLGHGMASVLTPEQWIPECGRAFVLRWYDAE